MIFRIAVLVALSSLGCDTAMFAGDGPVSTVTVSWSDSIESPGVCVDREGWFISVIPDIVLIENLTSARLKGNGGAAESKVLFIDTIQRLCLLEARTPLPGISPFPITGIKALKAGQKLECVSNRSASLTIVAGKDWSYRGEHFSMPFLRVRVANPEEFCNSGTPLVSSEGQLAGILTGRELDTNGETRAIPVSRIRKLVEDVKRHKKSGPVWIGLIFHNQSSMPEVIDVKSASPAEQSGVKAGDVILSMNGVETESLEDLIEVVYSLPAGEETELTVLRGLSEEKLSIIPRFAEVTAASR